MCLSGVLNGQGLSPVRSKYQADEHGLFMCNDLARCTQDISNSGHMFTGGYVNFSSDVSKENLVIISREQPKLINRVVFHFNLGVDHQRSLSVGQQRNCQQSLLRSKRAMSTTIDFVSRSVWLVLAGARAPGAVVWQASRRSWENPLHARSACHFLAEQSPELKWIFSTATFWRKRFSPTTAPLICASTTSVKTRKNEKKARHLKVHSDEIWRNDKWCKAIANEDLACGLSLRSSAKPVTVCATV